MSAAGQICRSTSREGTAEMSQTRPYFQRPLVVVANRCCAEKGSAHGPSARSVVSIMAFLGARRTDATIEAVRWRYRTQLLPLAPNFAKLLNLKFFLLCCVMPIFA